MRTKKRVRNQSEGKERVRGQSEDQERMRSQSEGKGEGRREKPTREASRWPREPQGVEATSPSRGVQAIC